MKDKLNKVNELILEGARLKIEMLSYRYLIRRSERITYTRDVVATVLRVENLRSKFYETEESQLTNSGKIYDLLLEMDSDLNTNLSKLGGLEAYLEKFHSFEVSKFTHDQQREVTSKILGVSLNVEELTNKLEELEGLHTETYSL